LFVQLFRYTVVGGVAYVFDFSTLFILTEKFSLYYLHSAAIAFLLGLLINYSLSILWVFDHSKVRSRGFELAIFSIIGLLGLGLNHVFILAFTEYMLFHYLISKVFATFIVYMWNFFARKYILFT
jgi:putative flippase GtrA